jgi:glycosyltransferase involved in cell wall biosynthesis
VKKAYIYPVSGRDEKNLGLYNPYLDDFIDSSSRFFQFVNKDHPSKTGILNVSRYLFKLDYLFLNWIEKVPDLRGGKIQTWYVLMMLPIAKSMGIRIVWTMHNKLAHTSEFKKEKTKIFKSLLKHSDYIVTHSSEGIDFGEQMVKGSGKKIFYLPHPVKDRRSPMQIEQEYDVLIWGTLAPYKGVDKFLDHLYEQKLQKKYRIHIVGKPSSPEYARELEKYANERITFHSAFIEEDELRRLIAASRLVLFTYSKSSILSSGVLMDSLGFGARIVGPEVGAFADLGKEGILDNFNNFDELIEKVDQQLGSTNNEFHSSNLESFLKDNSWDRFSEKLAERILPEK